MVSNIEGRFLGNYLRVRGEYDTHYRIHASKSELPPRTRRILVVAGQPVPAPGTTSAYAENTQSNLHYTVKVRNYLRVRGEYMTRHSTRLVVSELPPRTRRIRDSALPGSIGAGTTSAYAENTCVFSMFAANFRNYLRVRGEYKKGSAMETQTEELPPRTRRILPLDKVTGKNKGTTSAYAENT